MLKAIYEKNIEKRGAKASKIRDEKS